jgi:hypothetical protein
MLRGYPALDLIGRMHGAGWYAHTRPDGLFEMPRIQPAALLPQKG